MKPSSPTRKQSHEADPGLESGTSPDIETDDGPPTKKSGEPADPQRRCIATGESKPQSQMIRFVVAPDNKVVPDVAARLPGRGAWVTSNIASLVQAIEKKAFYRAFKKTVEVPADLVEQTHALLFQRCLDFLGFAKRAGDLILGFDQVREELRMADPACLIEAADGASDGRKKILALAKAIYGDEESSEQPLIIGCFSSEELGMALGRDRVIHAIVTHGRSGSHWMAEVERLGGFRPLRPSDWMTLSGN